MSEHILDARNLLCPLPVIRTQNKISDLNQGDTLTVYCTDPGTLVDIPTWCRIHGHQVISTVEQKNEIIIKISVQH